MIRTNLTYEVMLAIINQVNRNLAAQRPQETPAKPESALDARIRARDEMRRRTLQEDD